MSMWRILVVMLLVALALFCISVAVARSGERLSMNLDRTVCYSPCSLEVELVVQPDAANRLVFVELSGDAYYSSSEVELDGENARKRHQLHYTMIPGGAYLVRATLYDNLSRPIDRITRQLQVAGANGTLKRKLEAAR